MRLLKRVKGAFYLIRSFTGVCVDKLPVCKRSLVIVKSIGFFLGKKVQSIRSYAFCLGSVSRKREKNKVHSLPYCTLGAQFSSSSSCCYWCKMRPHFFSSLQQLLPLHCLPLLLSPLLLCVAFKIRPITHARHATLAPQRSEWSTVLIWQQWFMACSSKMHDSCPHQINRTAQTWPAHPLSLSLSSSMSHSWGICCTNSHIFHQILLFLHPSKTTVAFTTSSILILALRVSFYPHRNSSTSSPAPNSSATFARDGKMFTTCQANHLPPADAEGDKVFIQTHTHTSTQDPDIYLHIRISRHTQMDRCRHTWNALESVI